MPSNAVLISRAGPLTLALPLGQVVGVTQPGPVTPLPSSSPIVEGVVLAMGLAVVQVAAFEPLGLPPEPEGVLVVLRQAEDVRALRLSAVVAMADVEVLDAAGDRGVPWSAGTVAWRGQPVPLLDLGYVWGRADLPVEGDSGATGLAQLALASGGRAASDGASPADQGAHLLFSAGDELYCMDTEQVLELLPVARPRPVPGAPHWVAGLVERRGAPILAIDTRALLGHGGEADDRLALLVSRDGEETIALLIQQALGIHRFARDELHAMREATAGVTRYAVMGGARIVGAIDASALLEQVADRLRDFIPRSAPVEILPAGVEERRGDADRVLVVETGSDLFALPLDRIDRILPAVALSTLPSDGNGFDGLVDIGGLPVPALDLRRADSRGAAARPAPCLLVRLEGATAALLVDRVLQIESLPADAIDPVVADGRSPVSGVVSLQGRAVAMLMLDRLLPILA